MSTDCSPACRRPPPRPGLVRGRDASDLMTLAALSRETKIRDLAIGRRMVRKLWDACQIPDFRKLADDSHARFCARVFDHLAREGHLPADWLDGQVAVLDRADGDIDTLMQRLSGVRVWSYIAARPGWVRDAAGLQDRARAVEDKLSDALHEKLTARFVDRRSTLLIRRLENSEGETLLSAVTPRGEVVVEGHSVGLVEGFGFTPDPAAVGEEKRLVLRAARRALRQEMPRRVEALIGEPDTAIDLGPDGRISWSGAQIARLRPGTSLLRPLVEVADSEYLDSPQRERVRVRLQAFMTATVAADLAPILRLAQLADPALRGALHQLGDAGGVAAPIQLPTPDRARLKAMGIRAGRFGLYHPAALKPRPMTLRSLLWAVANKVAQPDLPPGRNRFTACALRLAAELRGGHGLVRRRTRAAAAGRCRTGRCRTRLCHAPGVPPPCRPTWPPACRSASNTYRPCCVPSAPGSLLRQCWTPRHSARPPPRCSPPGLVGRRPGHAKRRQRSRSGLTDPLPPSLPCVAILERDGRPDLAAT